MIITIKLSQMKKPKKKLSDLSKVNNKLVAQLNFEF